MIVRFFPEPSHCWCIWLVTATAIALSGMAMEPGDSEFDDTAIAESREVASEKGSIVGDTPIACGTRQGWPGFCFSNSAHFAALFASASACALTFFWFVALASSESGNKLILFLTAPLRHFSTPSYSSVSSRL